MGMGWFCGAHAEQMRGYGATVTDHTPAAVSATYAKTIEAARHAMDNSVELPPELPSLINKAVKTLAQHRQRAALTEVLCDLAAVLRDMPDSGLTISDAYLPKGFLASVEPTDPTNGSNGSAA